jgi:hypothetical protein
VPVTNGAIPVAPGGGHSSQAGTLLELVAAPTAEAPADPERPDDGAADKTGRAGMAAPRDPTPGETPAAELPEPPETVEGAAVVAGNRTAPYGFASEMPAAPPVIAVV